MSVPAHSIPAMWNRNGSHTRRSFENRVQLALCIQMIHGLFRRRLRASIRRYRVRTALVLRDRHLRPARNRNFLHFHRIIRRRRHSQSLDISAISISTCDIRRPFSRNGILHLFFWCEFRIFLRSHGFERGSVESLVLNLACLALCGYALHMLVLCDF